MNECPDCGKPMRGVRCPCGYGQASDGPKAPAVTGCEWQSFGARRCLMPGSASLDGRRWLCSWHLASLASPRTVDDGQEFGAWLTMLLGAAECSEWTHWKPDMLWDAVQGRRALAGYRQPCQQPLCPHRAALEDWQGTPHEALARIRRDLARIGSPPVSSSAGSMGQASLVASR